MGFRLSRLSVGSEGQIGPYNIWDREQGREGGRGNGSRKSRHFPPSFPGENVMIRAGPAVKLTFRVPAIKFDQWY